MTACGVSVPLDDPTSFSTRIVTARDYTLVRVLSEDGAEGIGFCYAGNVGGEVVTTAVRELLAPYSSVRTPTESKGCGKRCIRKPCCMDAPAPSCAPSAPWT